jgi:hypothetical protein
MEFSFFMCREWICIDLGKESHKTITRNAYELSNKTTTESDDFGGVSVGSALLVQRLGQPQGHNAAGRIRSTDNDLIANTAG